MPIKRLPDAADITQLKHQAKDLLRLFRAGAPGALQRVREFHPKFDALTDDTLQTVTFSLSEAQLSIAREYGYASWPRLHQVVMQDDALTYDDQIPDGPFKQALDFLDEGNAALLQEHLVAHPDVLHQQMQFEGGNYFQRPTLLEFVAQNPTRLAHMPDNIVDLTRIILQAGAKDNAGAVNETLGLVASGRLARECGAQLPLLDLLCDFGADPNAGIGAAMVHRETAATQKLLDRGAALTLEIAAGMGWEKEVTSHIKGATAIQLQTALAYAALHDNGRIITTLIGQGADPNQYNPPGGHSHCTPLHSAVFEGQFAAVKALVEGGARADIGDIHHGATALGWAEHVGQTEIAAYLRASCPAPPHRGS